MITTLWATVAVCCYFGGIYLSVVLAGVVAVCVLAGLYNYEERLTAWGRLSLSGLVGSMLMTTPTLFTATPYDPWVFNISRVFLAMYFAERFGIPVFWKLVTDRRVKSNQSAMDLKKGRGRSYRDVL